MRGSKTREIDKNIVYSLNDTAEWQSALDAFGSTDIYFSWQYHHLCQIDTGREARAFYASDGENRLFFPFLLKQIEGTAFHDFETCYGYSGPLSNTTDSEILEKLWRPFFDWCETAGIIAGFIRCHPLLSTENFLPDSFTQK